jgi:hypothetical protein
MTIDVVIASKIKSCAPLTALIGNRSFPAPAQPGVTVPFLYWELVSEDRESGFGSDLGLVHARYQFDVWAQSFVSRRDVCIALINCLQRWHDPVSDPPVHDCFIDNRQTLFDDTTAFYRGIVDVQLHHAEP